MYKVGKRVREFPAHGNSRVSREISDVGPEHLIVNICTYLPHICIYIVIAVF